MRPCFIQARRPFAAAVVLASLLIATPARAGDAVSAADLESFLGLSAGALDGLAAPAFDGSGLRTSFSAAAGDVLSFRFNFLTNEDPGAIADLINDFAFVSLDGADPTLLAEVATTTFTTSMTSFAMESGIATFSLTIAAAGVHTLGLGVVNVVDEMFPSALLLDGFALNGVGLPGGGFEAGTLAGFEGIGAFAVVGDDIGSPAPEGRFQAFVTSGSTAVPEPASLISLLLGASGVVAVAVRRRANVASPA
ncbi:PEP-CTERM sorting domain-containing protein [Paludisphaera mucosa]|uniref:PEP-CTERM sorting domain-containing protein n=1 Tax=Paludisphaera mucosa TaxID=3030827 RepID=A0ABT6F9S6_9BACT|nr:PEP-CTERM sorting domain-containing protein [Paludisphaera mucosa]MDG3004135.1 PEP-CTERM sorting domain-containing protein [Paludisphaera mucosa]